MHHLPPKIWKDFRFQNIFTVKMCLIFCENKNIRKTISQTLSIFAIYCPFVKMKECVSMGTPWWISLWQKSHEVFPLKAQSQGYRSRFSNYCQSRTNPMLPTYGMPAIINIFILILLIILINILCDGGFRIRSIFDRIPIQHRRI